MAVPESPAKLKKSVAERAAPALALAAIGYNALLAFINAHLFRMNTGVVILSEIVVIGLALLVSVQAGLDRYKVASLLFPAPFIFIALVISLVNETIFPDAVRNILIISAFTALGYSISERGLRACFMTVGIAVTAFLILEISYLEGYVAVFEPAQYLQATRGYEEFEFNETGLFAGALGYEDRFSYGIYSGPRTSSIFLEQVSLAGFAALLSIFLAGNWGQLGWRPRLFYVVLILGILVTNNTRASSALALMFPLGYFIFPRLSPRLTWFIAPALLALAFILVGLLRPEGGTSDDFIGRLAVTVTDLQELSVGSLLFGSLEVARSAYDSGYVYILASSSIFGLLLFWAYVNAMPASRTDDQRRVRWAAGIYIWAWLLIGGTAIFSMKTSSLLWLTVGALAARTAASRNSEQRRPALPSYRPGRPRLRAGLG